MSGFIKTYRKMKDSAIWDMPPEYLKIWTWLLLSANHKEKRIPNRDGSFMAINPGQLATSYRQIAEQTGHYERLTRKTQNPKTIKSILEFMEKQGMISVEGNTQGTIVTIINWSVYQGVEDKQSNTVETQSNSKSNTESCGLTEINTNECDCDSDGKVTLDKHSGNTGETLGKHLLDTNKNAKNVQEEESKSHSPKSGEPISGLLSDPLDNEKELSDFYDQLTTFISCEHQHAKIPAMHTKDWYAWRDTLDKLKRIDKYACSEIIGALTWAFCEEEPNVGWDGWKAQIKSVMQLRMRSKSNGQRKFDNIHESWKRSRARDARKKQWHREPVDIAGFDVNDLPF